MCHFLTTKSTILTWVWFHFVTIILLSNIFLRSLPPCPISSFQRTCFLDLLFINQLVFAGSLLWLYYRNPLQCPLPPYSPHSFFVFTFFSSSPIILLHCSWILESIFCSISLLPISQSLPRFPLQKLGNIVFIKTMFMYPLLVKMTVSQSMCSFSYLALLPVLFYETYFWFICPLFVCCVDIFLHPLMWI